MADLRYTWSDWPDPDGHVWELRHSWAVTPEGGLKLTGLDLYSPEGHRLTRSVLVAIPLEPKPDAQLDIGEAIVKPGGSWRPATELPETKVGRPVRYGPAHYSRVAEVYQDAKREDNKQPRQTVMRRFGLTERTASRHIAEARRLGFLRPKED